MEEDNLFNFLKLIIERESIIEILNDYSDSIERFGIYVDDSGRIYLSDMYIRKERCGQGVGGAVMKRLCEFAELEKMSIWCIPSSDDDGSGDERLVRFYSKFGFEVERQYGRGLVTMVKKVNKF